ncbi:hypothetical protein FRC05_006250 [Tulasnella sp. 425]|nr:hypothetical protein FRC05_006250 [Tulasnella sp. 425]
MPKALAVPRWKTPDGKTSRDYDRDMLSHARDANAKKLIQHNGSPSKPNGKRIMIASLDPNRARCGHLMVVHRGHYVVETRSVSPSPAPPSVHSRQSTPATGNAGPSQPSVTSPNNDFVLPPIPPLTGPEPETDGDAELMELGQELIKTNDQLFEDNEKLREDLERLNARIANMETRGAGYQRKSRARGAAENSFQECVRDAALIAMGVEQIAFDGGIMLETRYPDEPRDFETNWPTKEWVDERRLTWAWSRGGRHGFNLSAAEALAEFIMKDDKYQFFDFRKDEKDAIVAYILQHYKYLRKKRQDQLDPTPVLDDIHLKRQKASHQRRREALIAVCERDDEEELHAFVPLLQKAGPEILSSDDEDTAPGQVKTYKRNKKPYRSAAGHQWITSLRHYERIVNAKSKSQGRRHRIESDRISLETPRTGRTGTCPNTSEKRLQVPENGLGRYLSEIERLFTSVINLLCRTFKLTASLYP